MSTPRKPRKKSVDCGFGTAAQFASCAAKRASRRQRYHPSAAPRGPARIEKDGLLMADSLSLTADQRSSLSRVFTLALDIDDVLRGINSQSNDAEAAAAFHCATPSRWELERLLKEIGGYVDQLPAELRHAVASLSDAILQPRLNGNASFADAGRAMAAADFKGPGRDGLGYLQADDLDRFSASDPRNQGILKRMASLSPLRHPVEPDAPALESHIQSPTGDVANRQGLDGAGSPTGFLGGVELADALGVHSTRRDAFGKQLERLRIKLGDKNWLESRDLRPNCPRYLYRAEHPQLRSLALKYAEPRPA